MCSTVSAMRRVLSMLTIVGVVLSGCDVATDPVQRATATVDELDARTVVSTPEPLGIIDAPSPAVTRVALTTASSDPPLRETRPTDAENYAAVATPEPHVSGVKEIETEVLAEGLDQPVFIGHAGDASGRLFVVEKHGVIRVIKDDQLLAKPFLDIRDRVGSSENEQGLFSFAFHPSYATNGRVFVDYTDQNGSTVIAEFEADPLGAVADRESERVVLNILQPFRNHNGGMLAFSPIDGFLYISVGDGGSSGDPHSNGQNPATLLGSILRINVDTDANYGIPVDNPFVNDPGSRSEIFVFGLRNPWRFSFDRLTGDLWIGDVGQRDLEEINLAMAPLRGGINFGWNAMEGSQCFPPVRHELASCTSRNFQGPVAEYGRGKGCSVTGGYVYRGRRFPTLAGTYVFGDYCSGRIWTLALDPDGDWRMVERAKINARISSFGEGGDGEIYMVDHSGGRVLRLLVGGERPAG